MGTLTPGAQIDELRRVLRESEQRRQIAETKLADCDRRLGAACQTIAAQDHQIGWLMAELARLRGAGAMAVLDEYAHDAAWFATVYTPTGHRPSLPHAS